MLKIKDFYWIKPHAFPGLSNCPKHAVVFPCGNWVFCLCGNSVHVVQFTIFFTDILGLVLPSTSSEYPTSILNDWPHVLNHKVAGSVKLSPHWPMPMGSHWWDEAAGYHGWNPRKPSGRVFIGPASQKRRISGKYFHNCYSVFMSNRLSAEERLRMVQAVYIGSTVAWCQLKAPHHIEDMADSGLYANSSQIESFCWSSLAHDAMKCWARSGAISIFRTESGALNSTRAVSRDTFRYPLAQFNCFAMLIAFQVWTTSSLIPRRCSHTSISFMHGIESARMQVLRMFGCMTYATATRAFW